MATMRRYQVLVISEGGAVTIKEIASTSPGGAIQSVLDRLAPSARNDVTIVTVVQTPTKALHPTAERTAA